METQRDQMTLLRMGNDVFVPVSGIGLLIGAVCIMINILIIDENYQLTFYMCSVYEMLFAKVLLSRMEKIG